MFVLVEVAFTEGRKKIAPETASAFKKYPVFWG
jgi:hypothetical protein